MDESRIEKYKEYRNSIITNDAPSTESINSGGTDVKMHSVDQTTSTLPMDQVMQALGDEETEATFYQRQHKKKIILYVSLGIIGALVLAAIIVFGILLFK